MINKFAYILDTIDAVSPGSAGSQCQWHACDYFWSTFNQGLLDLVQKIAILVMTCGIYYITSISPPISKDQFLSRRKLECNWYNYVRHCLLIYIKGITNGFLFRYAIPW